MLNEGSPPLIYSFLVVECWPMVLETIWFRAACLGFFPPFLIILYFSSILGIFAIFRGILDIFGGKMGFLAFWRYFRPFGGFLDGFMAF